MCGDGGRIGVLLCEHEGDEVAQMHGLRGRPSTSVQVERLVVSVCIQYTLHVSV